MNWQSLGNSKNMVGERETDLKNIPEFWLVQLIEWLSNYLK